MSVNTLVTEQLGQDRFTDAERLPALTAGFAIVGLSLLCWLPLLLPLIVFLHR
jgi:hypothetical protein